MCSISFVRFKLSQLLAMNDRVFRAKHFVNDITSIWQRTVVTFDMRFFGQKSRPWREDTNTHCMNYYVMYSLGKFTASDDVLIGANGAYYADFFTQQCSVKIFQSRHGRDFDRQYHCQTSLPPLCLIASNRRIGHSVTTTHFSPLFSG